MSYSDRLSRTCFSTICCYFSDPTLTLTLLNPREKERDWERDFFLNQTPSWRQKLRLRNYLNHFGVLSDRTKVAFALLTFAHLTCALLSHSHCCLFRTVGIRTSGFALVSFALLSFALLSGYRTRLWTFRKWSTEFRSDSVWIDRLSDRFGINFRNSHPDLNIPSKKFRRTECKTSLLQTFTMEQIDRQAQDVDLPLSLLPWVNVYRKEPSAFIYDEHSRDCTMFHFGIYRHSKETRSLASMCSTKRQWWTMLQRYGSTKDVAQELWIQREVWTWRKKAKKPACSCTTK